MTRLGIAVSVVYICVIILLRWSSLSDLRTMPLNEFGDFFAGVFGPLTLFWLILGYMQQQKELRQNTKALELQAEELKKSVEQHKELVKVSREQMETEFRALELEERREREKSAPNIKTFDRAEYVHNGKGGRYYRLECKNMGGHACEVCFFEESGHIEMLETRRNILERGSVFEIAWMDNGSMPDDFVLVIEYQDAFKKRYQKEFYLEKNHQNHYKLVSEKEVEI